MRHPRIAVLVVLLHILPLVTWPAKAKKPQVVHTRTLIREFEFVPRMDGGTGVSDCPEFYWGYGFKTGWAGGNVGEVAPGYAADRAGLRAGDVIEDLEPGTQSGPGVATTFRVRRGELRFMLTMVSERICQR